MKQREFLIHIHVASFVKFNETECSTYDILCHVMNYKKQMRQNKQVCKYNLHVHVIHEGLLLVNCTCIENIHVPVLCLSQDATFQSLESLIHIFRSLSISIFK